MFTNDTLLALNFAQELGYKTAELLRVTTQAHCVEQVGKVITAESLKTLAAIAQTPCAVAYTLMVEVLEAVAPQFEGTPFQAQMVDIIASYKEGSDRSLLHGSVELSTVINKGRQWMNEQELLAKPLQTYLVSSIYGEKTVQARSPDHARTEALRQHYGDMADNVGWNALREFGVGRLVEQAA